MRHRAPAHPVPVGRSRFRHCKNTSAPAGKIIRITVLVTIITVLLRCRPAKAPNTRPVTRFNRRSVRLFRRVAGLPSPRPTHTATGDIRHDRMRPSYCPRCIPGPTIAPDRPPSHGGSNKTAPGVSLFALLFLFLQKTTQPMDQVMRLDQVRQYNELLHVETLHPLVSVIDFSQCRMTEHIRFSFGFYAIFLKEVRCGDLTYGRSTYDYQEGTLVCLAPGQCIGIDNRGVKFQPKGWALLFHPDLLRGTELGRNIRRYTFFSYEVREALHLSEQERQTVIECLRNIRHELQQPADRHSRTLIVNNIEMLLNYCTRFYDRQFITRSQVANKDILTRFEQILNDYFASEQPLDAGLPTVQYCAAQLHLSPNYFGDLVKRETGRTAQEHIQLRLIDAAKERIADPGRPISDVAYCLGFKYPQHFTRLFKKITGLTPNEYRKTV